MAISDKIKEHRTKCGMTQAQLAEALGVTPQAVSKWEKGTGCPDDEYKPEIDRLAKLIRDDMTEPELSTVIYDLFLEMFSQPISKDLCDKMAKEILSQD